MTVRLQPLTKETWRYVYRLSETLSEEQNNFVADNGFSMLEAIWDHEIFTAFGIFNDETPVGFFMRGYDASEDSHWVVRLMIGAEHQRKGYGRAALGAAIEQFKAMPGCKEVFISFEPTNHAARALYESVGFRDTGRIEEGEFIFRIPLLQDQMS